MSVLMALCLFAAIALAIPGFTARADSNDGPYSIPNTSFIVSLENAFDFEAQYGKTGYWGVILDNGRVTPTSAVTFERDGETVAPTADDLWKAAPLNSYSMIVPVPNGTNNIEGITWEPGTSHWVTIVTYKDDKTLATTSSYSVQVFKPYNPGDVDPAPEPAPEPTTDPAPEPAPVPTTDPAPEPAPVPTTDPAPQPAPEPTTDPAPQPAPEPTVAPVPQPDDPELPVVQPTQAPSVSPTPSPSASSSPAAHSSQPSDTPVSPVTDESQLTDANKGGVSAAFTGGQLTINVPSDKAVAGEWVSANIMQTGEARWLQVEPSNQVTMDVTGLPMGDYKVVVANRSHQLVGWAEFKVASTVAAASPGTAVDGSGSVKLHAEVLSSSNSGDESEGLNGYLLGAGACMLILGGLVVLQVLSGPKIGSSSQGVTLT
ncbi:type IV secretion protein Rhs [Schaalia odontolytica]|uniref:type IV secretion protein Rhs n=1 Tax=Schaalia odontolytica TaxID=1660 RepID=UPI001D06F049|nr:type IV secretion protein Rhs [Schaalia odontolytica]MCB6401608.1 type IV secretion protein Rhs [Schaalia odontolytica]